MLAASPIAVMVAAGCTSTPATTHPLGGSAPALPAASASSSATDADAAPVPAAAHASSESDLASRCPPPSAGQVSDDDAPRLHGVGAEAEPFAWLAARGVGRSVALAWRAQNEARHHIKSAETTEAFDGPCHTLSVGEPAEDSLLCEVTSLEPLMPTRALALVVRAKHIVVVLDVGLGIGAMDFPDARWLDLSLSFSTGGLEADVRDRAPNGAKLVEAPSLCREREAHLATCAQTLSLRRYDLTTDSDACPTPCSYETVGDCSVLRAQDGRRYIAPPPPSLGLPAVLHDCAGARAQLRDAFADIGTSLPDAHVFRGALGTVDEYCRQRAHWVWRHGHFAQEH